LEKALEKVETSLQQQQQRPLQTTAERLPLELPKYVL
jgi:hypothetical protein